VPNSSIFTPALLRTHSLVLFVVHETRKSFLSPFISKASRRVFSFFLSVQRSQPYVAIGHTSTALSFFHSSVSSMLEFVRYTNFVIIIIIVVSSLKSVCCDFSIFYTMTPRSPAPCLTWFTYSCVAFYIFVAGNRRHFKFGMPIDHSKSQPMDDKLSLSPFKFWWTPIRQLIDQSCRGH